MAFGAVIPFVLVTPTRRSAVQKIKLLKLSIYDGHRVQPEPLVNYRRIGRPKNQKRTLDALGLTKMHKTVEHNATPQILGMVHKIKHLIKVVESK